MAITGTVLSAVARGTYVQLAASASGATLVTISRFDSGGGQVVVRGGEDADISGGLVTLYDFEAPQGRTLTYRATFTDGVATVKVDATTEEVDYGGDWLMPVGRTELGMNVYVEYDGVGSLERPVIRDVVQVINRPSPIVVSWGRQMWNGQMTFITLTEAERRRFIALLTYPILMFAARPGYGFDENLFASVGSVSEVRTTGLGAETSRRWEVDLQEIQRPPAYYVPPPPSATWASRTAEADTWGQVASEFDWFTYAGFE